MKRWVPLTFIALAASIGFAPVGHAQPRPGDHPGDRPGDHPGDKPGDKPGERGGAAAAAEYAAKLQKIEDDRRKQRDDDRKDAKKWDSERDKRADDRRKALEGVWGAPFLGRPEVRSEMELHAERVARIERVIDIAQDTHNAALLAHAQRVLAKEFARNARVMAELRERLGVR